MTSGSPRQVREPGLTWWEARLIRRVQRIDLVVGAVLLALASATVMSGRRAAASLKPASAVRAAEMLDELELPDELPDAPLADSSGKIETLRGRIKQAYAVVAFYAPWCGPCQKELPQLVSEVGSRAQLLVVTSKDEDVEYTTRQLANLGVGVTALVDSSGALFREAKIVALPTTFLVTNQGSVILASKGYSWLGLFRIGERLKPDDDFIPQVAP